MRLAFVACAFAACAIARLDLDGVVPETLVEEMGDESGVAITRECFERACVNGKCRLAKMGCPQRRVPGGLPPWAVFSTPEQRLVSTAAVQEAAPDLVDVVQHKHNLDPNKAIEMPGVPAEAPASLLTKMKEEEALLHKITKLEKLELQKDPLHKKSRSQWLELADTIKHMPPSPEKLKNEVMLLNLAKQLAAQEQDEHAKGQSTSETQEAAPEKKEHKDETPTKALPADKEAMLKKLVNAVIEQHNAQVQGTKDSKSLPTASKEEVAREILPFLTKIMGKAGQGQEQEEHSSEDSEDGDTIDGIPVGHRKCYERACVRVLPDGSCATAVISCGSPDGETPAHKSKLSKSDALKLAKHSMGALFPGANNAVAGEPKFQVQPLMIVSEAP